MVDVPQLAPSRVRGHAPPHCGVQLCQGMQSFCALPRPHGLLQLGAPEYTPLVWELQVHGSMLWRLLCCGPVLMHGCGASTVPA